MMKSVGHSPPFVTREPNIDLTCSEEQGRSISLYDFATSGPRLRKESLSKWTTINIKRIVLNTRSNPLTLLLVVLLFLDVVDAQDMVHPDLPHMGELLFDRSPAPDSPHGQVLMARADASSSTSIVAAAPSNSVATAPGSKATPLPQPFDTSLGNNFTSTACPAYFTEFLADTTFRSCYPFSLLLQTSNVFFEAEKSYFKTTLVLDAGCKANFPKCNKLMLNIAYKIRQSEVCASDFEAQNPLVLQAYNGLLAYQSMYQAGCMKDTAGSYCFANAITGTNSSLADVYPYWLPLGTDMRSDTRATCSPCMKNTMNIFRASAANSSLPISKTYVAAAQLVNIGCGPQYVNDTIDYRTSTSSAIAFRTSMAPIVTLVLIFIAFVD